MKILNCTFKIEQYLITLILLFASLVGTTSVAAQDTIRIYAASSMTNVIGELIDRYSQNNFSEQDVKVVAVFAGSSAIARQIENGAPADIYISANQKWVDYLLSQQISSRDKLAVLAKNSLVVVAPKSDDNSSNLGEFNLADSHAWQQKLANNRLAIAQPDSVPAGIYAKQALTWLSVWPSVSDKLAPSKNVRSALSLVERGEASLGIVYQTDAMISNKVSIVASFASSTHDPIVYPMLQISEKPAVSQLYQYLTSPEAKKVFLKYGFK